MPRAPRPRADQVPTRLLAASCPRFLALTLLVTLLPVASRAAAPTVLQEARFQAAFIDSSTCEVSAAFTVAAGDAIAIEHRLQLLDGAAVELLDSAGADLVGPPAPSGQTQVLQVRAKAPEGDRYSFSYRVVQPAGHAYRCPLWLPVAPADGRSRNVHVRVALPAGATPEGGAFPALQWTATEGTATLGHVPAFLLVPFAAAGESGTERWSISGVMDTTALVLLVAGMMAFAWRRRGRA